MLAIFFVILMSTELIGEGVIKNDNCTNNICLNFILHKDVVFNLFDIELSSKIIETR